MLILFLIAFRVQKGVVSKFGDFYLENSIYQARARKSPSARKRVEKEIKMGKIIDCSRSLICLLLFFSFVFLFSSCLEGHLDHGISASCTKNLTGNLTLQQVSLCFLSVLLKTDSLDNAIQEL